MKHITRTAVATALLIAASLPASAANLDSLSGPFNWKLQGVTTEFGAGTYGTGALAETTWGVGEVTQINKTNGLNAWTGGTSDGTYLYYMIYGIADLSITGVAPNLNIYNVGCVGGLSCDGKIHLDIYRTTTQVGILGLAPSSRIDFDSFAGVTDIAGSSLYMQWEFAQGKVTLDEIGTLVNETLTTLKQTASTNVLPASGTGTFFADVVGGSAKTQWDTNGFPTAAGNADFDGNFTLKPNFTSTGGFCDPTAAAADCFYGLINDPVQSNAIPEPGSLALAGLALLGIFGARRRRNI